MQAAKMKSEHVVEENTEQHSKASVSKRLTMMMIKRTTTKEIEEGLSTDIFEKLRFALVLIAQTGITVDTSSARQLFLLLLRFSAKREV